MARRFFLTNTENDFRVRLSKSNSLFPTSSLTKRIYSELTSSILMSSNLLKPYTSLGNDEEITQNMNTTQTRNKSFLILINKKAHPHPSTAPPKPFTKTDLLQIIDRHSQKPPPGPSLFSKSVFINVPNLCTCITPIIYISHSKNRSP